MSERRSPAIEKKISQIDENDLRVKIVGNIVSLDESIPMIVVDDGSGIANVIVDEIKFNIGAQVRVIGKVINTEPVEIRAEIVQDFSKVDRETYEKYLEVLRKALKS